MTQIASLWLQWPETKTLAQAIEPLRFVGGCVRDGLLGRDVHDVDAATSLLPQDVMKRLEQAGLKAIPTGIEHGTVTAFVGKRYFEITTLRRDVSTDGRHATVAFTHDWKEDASRRDFTMNALYCDIHGQIFDYFGGADDAKAGRVRFIGEAHARIAEDALRILRFFRFFAYYSRQPLDAQAIKACSEQASLIDSLSGERVQQEMFKLLVAERAAEVVGVMQRHNVWERVVPCIVKTDTLDRLPLILRKTKHTPDALLSLALLLRSAASGSLVEGLAKRWKLSKAHHKQLDLLCVKQAELWHMLQEKEWKKQIRAWGKDLFIDRAVLAMAEGAEEATVLAAITLAREWDVPVFPVTGDDLIAQGVKPGKVLGETLKVLENKWEEGGYTADKNTLLSKIA